MNNCLAICEPVCVERQSNHGRNKELLGESNEIINSFFTQCVTFNYNYCLLSFSYLYLRSGALDAAESKVQFA